MASSWPSSISMSEEASSKTFAISLLPVFANLLKPDSGMQALIDRDSRAACRSASAETLATADQLLYRRGNFNGPMDQVICDALRQELDAQIALSPGFRWGATDARRASRSRWRMCCRRQPSPIPKSTFRR